MKTLFKSLAPIAVVAIAVIMLAAPSQAQAQCGPNNGCGMGGVYGYGFGGAGSPYATGRIPTPPYFALHPPVYYSAPVARTYGYSPFAYPGSVRTPEVITQDHSSMIVNPFVQPVKAEPSKEEVKTPSDSDTALNATPLMIVNPFVDQSPATVEVHMAAFK